jgi:HD-like signal output (HDOD) protein
MSSRLINSNELINRVREFPTLPTIYSSLMDLMQNPRTTSVELAHLLTQDQASSSKLLKVANSAIYGLQGRINTVSQAILYIGFDEVKNIVTALTIIKLFNTVNSRSEINPVDLWKHSIGVGIITRQIGKSTGIRNLENYFLSGILHDLGKLVFLKMIPAEYSQVMEYSINNKVTIREAENKLLGITHTVIGEMLTEKWRLPNSIKNAIRYHTTGMVDNTFDHLVGTVHIANIVANMYGMGYSWENIVPEPNIEIWNKMNLPEKFFTNNYNYITMEFNESLSLLLNLRQ